MFSVGDNEYGQLGIGNTVNQSVFMEVKVEGIRRRQSQEERKRNDHNEDEIEYINCGYWFTFIVTKNNRLFSCGRNGSGELAQGNTNQ